MSYLERMKEYYDRRAPEYDASIPGLGDEAEHPGIVEDRPGLVRAISALPPARVLDVACGTGFFTQHLRGEVVGLDQSEAMLEIAHQRVPQASFVLGDALEMPFSDRSFDRVFSSSFYGLLLEPERERFLNEARRVAGELVLVEPTPLLSKSGHPEGWEERGLSDGSRHRIYRRYFSAEQLAVEIGGRVLFAGRWVVMAGCRRQQNPARDAHRFWTSAMRASENTLSRHLGGQPTNRSFISAYTSRNSHHGRSLA
jgi:ubiquinone/menaquinone biosynthesis C-methylase UbiE